jgi:hypothetical protein
MNIWPRMNLFTGIFGCSPHVPPAGGDKFLNFERYGIKTQRFLGLPRPETNLHGTSLQKWSQ